MIEVVLLSLRVAAVAVVASLPLAVGVAWLLARARFRGRVVVDAIVHLPLVLPPVVTGYLLLTLFSPRGPWGGLGLGFTTAGAALASAAVAFPLMVRPIRLAFEATDPGLLDAAKSLGANPWRAFWTIALPLARPGILAGALLAFGRSLGEFGATITFVGNIAGETRTLPLALYNALQIPGGEGEATTLALVSTALAFGALIAGELLARTGRWTYSR
ncbi:MAG: molybdate ABC transporter permease subunit [Proteobacteria bacterium]|nr:MAG: molybdate ABC transporter permease subunit [Pseudomonadota bacterium]